MWRIRAELPKNACTTQHVCVEWAVATHPMGELGDIDISEVLDILDDTNSTSSDKNESALRAVVTFATY